MKCKCTICDDEFFTYGRRRPRLTCGSFSCIEEHTRRYWREHHKKKRAENPEKLREKGRRSYAKRAAALAFVKELETKGLEALL